MRVSSTSVNRTLYLLLGLGLVKPRNATFLFDACFKYLCEQLFDIIGKDPVFAAGDGTKVDDIFESNRLTREKSLTE
jgi:hypothetical protein